MTDTIDAAGPESETQTMGPEPPKPPVPGSTETVWSGLPNYECTTCAYATTDLGAIASHVRRRCAPPPVPVDPDGPDDSAAAVVEVHAGAFFASEAANVAAEKYGLGPDAFDFEPSGKTGYTKADVERAAEQQELTDE